MREELRNKPLKDMSEEEKAELGASEYATKIYEEKEDFRRADISKLSKQVHESNPTISELLQLQSLKFMSEILKHLEWQQVQSLKTLEEKIRGQE